LGTKLQQKNKLRVGNFTDSGVGNFADIYCMKYAKFIILLTSTLF
jgi:hypothetical protein